MSVTTDQPSHDAANLSLVDAHVHLHDCYDRALFLDTARLNFDRAGEELGLGSGRPGVLLFSEISQTDAFAELATSPPTGWSSVATGEDISLRLVADTGAELTVVAGRQIATAEGLEVLVLGTRARFVDRTPIVDAVAAAVASGGLVVLPWGLGKWMGKRGELIAAFAENTSGYPRLYLGDSGNRPSGWPQPTQFALGETHGRLVLPGTDPLPLRADNGKAGRFGFIARITLGQNAPFQDLRTWLEARDRSPEIFGNRDRAHTAAHRQVMLRMNMR